MNSFHCNNCDIFKTVQVVCSVHTCICMDSVNVDIFPLLNNLIRDFNTLFYRDCLGEAHEPSSCDNWTKWFQRIGEIRPEESMNSILSM